MPISHISDLKQFDANDEDVLITLETFLELRETLKDLNLDHEDILSDLNKRFLKAFPDAPGQPKPSNSHIPLPPQPLTDYSRFRNALGYVVILREDGDLAPHFHNQLFSSPADALEGVRSKLMTLPGTNSANINFLLDKYTVVPVTKAA